MTYQNRFQITPDPSIKAYSFADGIVAQGYKTYYLCMAANSVSTTKFLSSSAIDSNTGLTSPSTRTSLGYQGNNSANAVRFDYDFDIGFNQAQTIQGKMIFNYTQEAVGTGGGQSCTIYCTINAYHVTSGGTETLLGTVTSPSTASSSTDYIVLRNCLDIDVTAKHFAIGQKLRINVQVFTAHGGVGNTLGYVYFDPTGATAMHDAGDTEDSTFEVQIPFRIY